MKKNFSILLLAVSVSSCGIIGSQVTRGVQYEKMYAEKPLTFLVMPPINNSNNVEAKDLLYTSISKPLNEAGYYVLPPLVMMDILQAESAYDAELFFDSNLTTFNKYFGADAVIFSIIDNWTKSGFGIRTKIRYVIKSAYTNEILFDKICDLYLSLQVQSRAGGIFDLAASAISTAVTDHIVAARKANKYIFQDVPRGKYSPDYMKDKNFPATKKEISATVN